MPTVTRADIIARVSERIGLPRAECARTVEGLLLLMKGAFDQDRSLKVAGFGTFALRIKAERAGRNPKTGEALTLPPRRVVTFKPSPMLRERLGRASGQDDGR